MKPVLQAILLADHVYQDVATGKYIVAGIFSSLWLAKNVPAQGGVVELGGGKKVPYVGGMTPGSPFAYISLTGAHGPTSLVLRYVDLLDNSVLFTIDVNFTCNDPLATIELALPLIPIPIPHAGSYALELLCGDEWLGSHRVNVTELKAPEAGT